jgi:dihydroorotate dehydrogenase (NAD+) catalytic subunit
MVASGCLGYGVERVQSTLIDQIGAFVTPTTHQRRRGPAPKLVEVPGGVLAIGNWPGRSIDVVLGRYAPIWANWRTPVLLSIAGEDLQAAIEIATHIEGLEGLAGIELNCAEVGSLLAVSTLVKAVRAATFVPLLVKLPAQPDDLLGWAQTAAHNGADALVISAPPVGQWFDLAGQQYNGWLCGPAQHPIALARVAKVVAAVHIPVIGSGGITDLAGVRRMLAAGATAIQIGSALLADPGLAAQLVADMMG